MGKYYFEKEFDREINEYEKNIDKFLKGELNPKQFKSLRVVMGVYEQRESGKYMVRCRVPGGILKPFQLANIGKIAEKYSNWPVHITTRQEIQVHNLELKDTLNVIKELKDIHLFTKGGGGNTVRNIIQNWDSGLSDDDVFDVYPYVLALTKRMLNEPDSWILPRKLKIAFVSKENIKGIAMVNDLGFIAKKVDNKKGFEVYIAGGMGGKSNIGFKIFDFIPDEEVYNVVKTSKRFFDKYGNRRNRHSARLRFILYKFGKEEFIKRFMDEYENVKNEKYLPLYINDKKINKNKNYLEIPIFLGDILPSDLQKIGFILKEVENEEVIRFTNNQNMAIVNLPDKEISKIKERLKKEKIIKNLDINWAIKNIVSCAGASTCKLGICLSKNLAKSILEKIEDTKLKNNKFFQNISINISGCPNSCGQHLIGNIGFYGTAKRKNGKYYPAYYILINGNIKGEKVQFGENIGFISAHYIPLFVTEFLENLATIYFNNQEEFYKIFNDNAKNLAQKIIIKYKEIPEFSVNKNFYYDIYSQKEFSLLDKLEGECSAGLFDFIDYNFDDAFKNIKEFKSSNEYKYLIYAFEKLCGALLITKGLEYKNTEEAVKLFDKHFVGRHVDDKYKILIEKYIKKEKIGINEIEELYNDLYSLYQNMDDNLKLPEIKSNEDKDDEEYNFKDLRGVPCPINFVKAKLILQQMRKGEKLKLYLDDGEPIENVPPSLQSEGHKILKKEKINNHWILLVEKG